MRNLLTFSASAVIHSIIAAGVGFLILSDELPQPKAKNIGEILEWQWVEEVLPTPPVVVEKTEPEPPPVVEKPSERASSLIEPKQEKPPSERVKKVEPVKEPPQPVVKKSKPKPKPKRKPRKKPKSRPVVKTKPKSKRQRKSTTFKPVKAKKSAPSEPLFKDFSDQNIRPAGKAFPKPRPTTKRNNNQKLTTQPVKPVTNPHALNDYKRRLHTLIERNKKYPRREQRMGVMGTAVIAFTVNADGRLSGIRVERSSGNGRLDAAALSAVKAVGRYRPPPNGAFNTRVSIEFVLR